VNIRCKPVTALVLSGAVVAAEVMINEKALVPNQHVEVPVPVEESVLTYAPTNTSTTGVQLLHSLWEYPEGPQFRVVR
jgi:hypothetical protein